MTTQTQNSPACNLRFCTKDKSLPHYIAGFDIGNHKELHISAYSAFNLFVLGSFTGNLSWR